MENIIYNELRYRGYRVDVGVVESREKDKDGKEIRKQLEIDFVANQGSKRYYIQSAYDIPDNAKWEQETRSFDKTNDSFKKIVIVERSMKPRRDDKGYVTMGVKEFLLTDKSLELLVINIKITLFQIGTRSVVMADVGLATRKGC